MLVCIFIMPPVVLLNRSNLPERLIWLIGIPAIAIGHYLGWLVGIVSFGFEDARSGAFHATLAISSVLVAPLITLVISLARAKRRRAIEAKREEIRRAIDRIMEDGVVSGPKGRYVPHRPIDVGIDPRTPSATKGPGGHGPYGIPMP
jgi:hypothetical protein